MQRKSRTNLSDKAEKMPFQMRIPEVQKQISVYGIEAAKAALPIFGGTSPTDPETKTEQKPEDQQQSSTTTTQSSGGEQPKQDPGAMTPQQISDLLESVSSLTGKVNELTTENQSFKSKTEEAERAKLSREEAMAKDLEKSQQTVAQMDAVIKHLAIVNAIQNNESGIEFHDVTQVIRELNADGFELNVDLERGEASVKKIENELKRVAQEKSWMVKAASQQQQEPVRTTQPPRSSGSGKPPANPGGQDTKATKRAQLEEKWPIITQGRARMPKLTR